MAGIGIGPISEPIQSSENLILGKEDLLIDPICFTSYLLMVIFEGALESTYCKNNSKYMKKFLIM